MLKKIIIAISIVIVIGAGVWVWYYFSQVHPTSIQKIVNNPGDYTGKELARRRDYRPDIIFRHSQVLQAQGQVWRRNSDHQEVVARSEIQRYCKGQDR